METLTKEQIHEIAEQLTCGFRCFWHKKTGELLFIPDELKNPEMEDEFFKEEKDKLKKGKRYFLEIEPLQSRDSFEIMAAFSEQLDDNPALKKHLIAALNKRKPFREFKWVIDNSGIYREKWFEFRHEKIKAWVVKKFEAFSGG